MPATMHAQRGPVWRRLLSGVVTLSVIGLAGAAVLGGQGLIARSAVTAPQVAAPRVAVGVMTVQPVAGYVLTRRFTGQTEAAARADLGFELGGRVAQMLVDEGTRVARGDVLAHLDVSALIPERAALQAELAALAADAELARLTLERNAALAEGGFRSVAAQDDARLGLARTEARMDSLRAQIAGVDVRLEKSVLTAPFDATIGARLADVGQTLAAGQAALVLFDAGPARLRVGLPPDLAAGLTVGGAVRVETPDGTLDARVLRIRPDLDASTRSRAVIVALPPGGAPVLGETATILLDQRVTAPGFWAPLGALREGARGSWSVMALEPSTEGDRVVPAAVEVLHTDGDRVFLRGALPPGARIVGSAPDRVVAGQVVLARAE